MEAQERKNKTLNIKQEEQKGSKEKIKSDTPEMEVYSQPKKFSEMEKKKNEQNPNEIKPPSKQPEPSKKPLARDSGYVTETSLNPSSTSGKNEKNQENRKQDLAEKRGEEKQKQPQKITAPNELSFEGPKNQENIKSMISGKIQEIKSDISKSLAQFNSQKLLGQRSTQTSSSLVIENPEKFREEPVNQASESFRNENYNPSRSMNYIPIPTGFSKEAPEKASPSSKFQEGNLDFKNIKNSLSSDSLQSQENSGSFAQHHKVLSCTLFHHISSLLSSLDNTFSPPSPETSSILCIIFSPILTF